MATPGMDLATIGVATHGVTATAGAAAMGGTAGAGVAVVCGVVAGGVVAHGTAAVAIGMVAAVAGMAEAEDITTNAVGAVPAEHHRRQARNVFPYNDHEKRNYTESLKV
jgi:hypothetical protein